MKKSVIYSIINIVTNQWYIGSTCDFEKRIKDHSRALRKGRHFNRKLQNSWNKYGETKFIFHLVENCKEQDCLFLEQVYIDGLSPYFNISKNSSSPMKGRKHSEETKRKQSRPAWNKGIPRTEDEKQLMSIRRKETADKMTEVERHAIAERARRHIEINGPPFKGKTHKEETKKLLRDALKSKRKILCVTTGEVFEAQKDAAIHYKIKQGHISENLNGKRKSVKGYIFVYV